MYVWNFNMNNEKDFKLGIAWQDFQHQRIIEIINEINSTPHVDYMSILAELTFYAKGHFDTEEQYMHEYAYDKTESHIEEHRAFVKKIVEISMKCLVGNELHLNLSSFLKNWFLNHILIVDKELAVFLLKYEHNNAYQFSR